MTRRTKRVHRARLRVLTAGSLLFASLYALSPLNGAGAAPPGALNLASVACFPAVSVDIRVSSLATGSGKTNVLHIEWTDGTTTAIADREITQASYAGLSQNDFYHFDWFADPAPTVTSQPVTANVTLTWVWQNENTKVVATDTATRACS